MFQPVVLYLAQRYSRAGQRSGFTRFINRFVMAGITLGVMSLIVVTAVMNGFEQELKERILGVVPQVTVTPPAGQPLPDWADLAGQLEWPQTVQQVSPFVQSEGLIQGRNDLQAVMLQGVFPEHEPADSVLSQHFVQGSIAALEAGEYQVLLGRPLASRLDVRPGDRVRLTAAAGAHRTPFGTLPAQRRFTVAGIFAVGADIDQQLVLVHGQDAARLFRYPEGSVSGLRFYLTDAFAAQQVATSLQAQPGLTAGNYQVRSWQDRYGRLFAAVQMEKGMMIIMLSLIVAVAAFNAVSALVMLVQDKRSDIAVLQTLGLSSTQLYLTLLLQGLHNGVIGVLAGLFLGLLGTWGLNPLLSLLGVEIFVEGMGLPIVIHWGQVTLITLSALCLTLLATLYPAWRAAHLQPAEILRYD